MRNVEIETEILFCADSWLAEFVRFKLPRVRFHVRVSRKKIPHHAARGKVSPLITFELKSVCLGPFFLRGDVWNRIGRVIVGYRSIEEINCSRILFGRP